MCKCKYCGGWEEVEENDLSAVRYGTLDNIEWGQKQSLADVEWRPEELVVFTLLKSENRSGLAAGFFALSREQRSNLSITKKVHTHIYRGPLWGQALRFIKGAVRLSRR